jgi:sugar phosphate isomerase/epimerase
MDLSVSTAAFDGYSFEVAAAEVARSGVRFIEPAFIKGYTAFDETSFEEAKAHALHAAMAAEGLAARAVSAHIDAGTDDAPAMLARRLRFARAIGADIVITNSTTPDQADGLRRTLDAVLPVCEATGVVVAFENPGHGRSLIGNAASGRALVDAVGSGFVRLNYDLGNVFTYSGEAVEPADDMAPALPVMAHAHLKDVLSTPAGWEFTAIGEGSIDMRRAVRLLAAVRPDCPIGLELPLRLSRPGRADPIRRADPLPLPAIREAVARSLRFCGAARAA